MKTFKTFLLEGGSTVGATEMEKHIVIAFNGGFDNAPDTYGVKKENYESAKHISEEIAKQIREKTKARPNTMIHFGMGKGKMISWWKGNSTPKTDLYSTDGINISLKQKGGSQLMSGLKDETLSTFKAAQMKIDQKPKEIDSLLVDLENVMKKIIVPGNINTIADVIKGKLPIPKTIKAKVQTSKSVEMSIDINKKEYEEKMKEMVDWKNNMKKLQPTFVKFFQENKTFKELFCHEAATGEIKFQPDEHASSNWVVEFDPNTGKNNTIEILTVNNEPSNFMKELAKKAKIRISPKTPTGSKVSRSGTASTSGSFRLDLSSTNVTVTDLINEEIDYFISNNLLVEDTLNEIKLIQSIKEWFKNLLNKIIDFAKTLAQKGLNYLTDFFEFEANNIETNGLELFGY